MKKIFVVSMIFASLVLGGAPSVAQENQDVKTENEAPKNDKTVEPMALRVIMKDLDKKMQELTSAISREDWEAAEKAGEYIAEHPQPPLGEKLRIIAFFKTDMGKFKSNDEMTHDSGNMLAKAAKSKDGEAVISAFQKIQTGCYGCHRDFRQKFIEHFYEGK